MNKNKKISECNHESANIDDWYKRHNDVIYYSISIHWRQTNYQGAKVIDFWILKEWNGKFFMILSEKKILKKKEKENFQKNKK